MRATATFAAAAIMLSLSPPSFAQTTQNPKDVLGSILGTLFGDRAGTNSSLESQWFLGRTPLLNQQAEFEQRVQNEVRSGNLTTTTGSRLTADYAALVQLETRYAADGRISTQERAELSSKYSALTQVLADRGYGDAGTGSPEVANGRAEFTGRVDAAVSARRITRAEGTRLKKDYTSLITTETSYLRDGVISPAERDDLDFRLDALDARLGDTNGAGVNRTPRARLDAVSRALPASTLGRAAKAQLLAEVSDLTRLADAYARLNVTADEQQYLDRRLGEVELRARGGR